MQYIVYSSISLHFNISLSLYFTAIVQTIINNNQKMHAYSQVTLYASAIPPTNICQARIAIKSELVGLVEAALMPTHHWRMLTNIH